MVSVGCIVRYLNSKGVYNNNQAQGNYLSIVRYLNLKDMYNVRYLINNI